MKRWPVRGQVVKWCVCSDWFVAEKDWNDHQPRCPGPMRKDGSKYPDWVSLLKR